MEKTAFRKLALRRRSQIPDRSEKSVRIVERLVATEAFQAASSVLVYVSFRSEVETHGLIKDLLAGGAKKVFVPFCDGDVLRVCELEAWDQLEVGAFGILEPDAVAKESSHSIESLYGKRGMGSSQVDIDLVIVPGVAFDRQLNRMGYGKGYYDRLLSGPLCEAKRIALAFDGQLSDQILTSENDVPMHEILTER